MEAFSPVLPSSPHVPEIVLAKDQPEYIPLPVAHVEYSDGTRSMISCYRLTLRERLRILFVGKVWWEQLTFGHPLRRSILIPMIRAEMRRRDRAKQVCELVCTETTV
jgi:hypothetical protein